MECSRLAIEGKVCTVAQCNSKRHPLKRILVSWTLQVCKGVNTFCREIMCVQASTLPVTCAIHVYQQLHANLCSATKDLSVTSHYG